MKPLRVLRKAALDLDAAYEWYESQRPGLGEELLQAFDSISQAINERPASFPIYHRKTRRALMQRFPYAVLFSDKSDSIRIVGVFHSARDPKTILRRSAD